MQLHLLQYHLLTLSIFMKFKQEAKNRYYKSLLSFLDLGLQYSNCSAGKGSPIISLDLAGKFKNHPLGH